MSYRRFVMPDSPFPTVAPRVKFATYMRYYEEFRLLLSLLDRLRFSLAYRYLRSSVLMFALVEAKGRPSPQRARRLVSRFTPVRLCIEGE